MKPLALQSAWRSTSKEYQIVVHSLRGCRLFDDSLVRWLIGVAFGLVLLDATLWLFFSPGQVTAVFTWFVPALYSFRVLASSSIAFLSLGRYLVSQQPPLFWIGIAFSSEAVLNVFFLLTFPGLISEQNGLIAHNPSTSAWLSILTSALLVIFLQIAMFARWPRAGALENRRWLCMWGSIMASILVIASLSVGFEEFLPLLVTGTIFSRSFFGEFYTGALVVVAAGTVLATRRYRQTGNSLFGYLALTELWFVFTYLNVASSDVRYSLLWYSGALGAIPGMAIMHFGLLSEYVSLYRREQQKTVALENERNRLQAVLNTAPDGIAFYLAPDGRLQLANKTAEDILDLPEGAEIGETNGHGYNDIHMPNGEDFPPEQLPVARSLAGETVFGVEGIIHQSSGRRLFVQVNSAPLRDAPGQIIGAVACIQDITLIKEQELLRDEFLSSAAHELKTPVTIIKGYAELMRRWTPQQRQVCETKAIKVINIQTDRINRRVQEMLEVVRFRKAPPELPNEIFDLGEVSAEVVQHMRSLTESIRLAIRCEGLVPVKADRERIEEVVVILLDNAIKYSLKDGEIHVRVWAESCEARASVTDGGVGIRKERQPYIFEPFFQSVPPGAIGYQSIVPLSLSLAKLIIERHQGRIWFDSDEGAGATFHFSLPLAKRTETGNVNGE